MVINFTDTQMAGLKAAYTVYNDAYKDGTIFEAYVERICQELAQSMTNKFIKAFTVDETVEATVKLAAMDKTSPVVAPADVLVQ